MTYGAIWVANNQMQQNARNMARGPQHCQHVLKRILGIPVRVCGEAARYGDRCGKHFSK